MKNIRVVWKKKTRNIKIYLSATICMADSHSISVDAIKRELGIPAFAECAMAVGNGCACPMTDFNHHPRDESVLIF